MSSTASANTVPLEPKVVIVNEVHDAAEDDTDHVESKSKDLGLQELQKGIVKASQPIIQLFDSALKARKDKSSMDPNFFAIFIGRRCYLSGACLISYIS